MNTQPDQSESERFYEDGVLVPSRVFAELDRLRLVYEAACAWADDPRPVTGGADGRLRNALARVRRLAFDEVRDGG